MEKTNVSSVLPQEDNSLKPKDKGGRPKGSKNKGGERIMEAFLAQDRINRIQDHYYRAHARCRELLALSGVDPTLAKSTPPSLYISLSPNSAVSLGITEILTKLEERVSRLSDITKYPPRRYKKRKDKEKP